MRLLLLIYLLILHGYLIVVFCSLFLSAYSVSPGISETYVILSSVLGSVVCTCLFVVFTLVLCKLIMCRRQISTLKVN